MCAANKKKILHSIAMAIRVVSIPPVMAAVMVLLMRTFYPAFFVHPADFWLTLLFLALLPVAAYPASYLILKCRDAGRKGQRNLAFGFSLVSYLLGLGYGFLFHRSRGLMMLFLTYFLSILLLCLFNHILHVHASGHATSVTGPTGVIGLRLGGWYILLSVALFALIFWASMQTKRHTVFEFLLGAICCAFSALISYFIFF